MSERDVDREAIERLIRSTAWDELLTYVLLPLYVQVTHGLDTARDDHRYLQGMKEGLRLAIERPYGIVEQPSPLTLSAPALRVRPRQSDEKKKESAPVLPIRQSYLA